MSQSSDVQPQWQPPSHLTDPLVRRFVWAEKDKKGRATWSRLSRGRIPGPREQAVAWRLADYANKDGHNAHPGMARLARDTCSSEKTVRRAMAWLTENGWCSVEHRGNRKLGEADVYTLSVPAPVAAEAGIWVPGQNGEQWMQRPKTEPKRPELRREKPGFPAANSDRWNDASEVIPDALEVTEDGLEVNSDLPPGLLHPGLSTPRRDSITGARQVERAILKAIQDLEPDGDEYGEELLTAIEDGIGAMVGLDTAAAVRGMAMSEVHPRVIIRKALAMECVEAS